MDVLMVAAELSPYARATRAADTVAALGKALAQTGHDVTVALPRYASFAAGGLLVARRLTPLKLDDGGQVTLFDGQLATGVKIVLFEVPELFDRPGLPGEGTETYADNDVRFATLCRAAAALVRQRAEQGQPFDVVHAHDWPAAPSLRLLAREAGPRPGLVLTLHDASRHGPVEPGVEASVSSDETGFAGPEKDRAFLGAGVLAADVVATVSPTYAVDLESGSMEPDVSAWLGKRRERVTGVLNGLDYAIYNPATDAALRARYDAEDASAKGSCKTELLRAHGLEIESGRPLVVAFVRDAVEEDLLRAALHDLLKTEASFIIGGTDGYTPGSLWSGDPARLEGVCAIGGAVDDTGLRRTCAAADFVLSPRRYDLDALIPRCAQRYGALPAAFSAGGAGDAIVDCDAHLETGTGFLFSEYTPAALVGAVNRGLTAYHSGRFAALRRRVMRLDLGWDRPARRYVQLYRQAIQWSKQEEPG